MAAMAMARDEMRRRDDGDLMGIIGMSWDFSWDYHGK